MGPKFIHWIFSPSLNMCLRLESISQLSQESEKMLHKLQNAQAEAPSNSSRKDVSGHPFASAAELLKRKILAEKYENSPSLPQLADHQGTLPIIAENVGRKGNAIDCRRYSIPYSSKGEIRTTTLSPASMPMSMLPALGLTIVFLCSYSFVQTEILRVQDTRQTSQSK